VTKKLLDLFCCAGGAGYGYQTAGFDVIGVDIQDQPNYAGNMFIQTDAIEFVKEHGHKFDAIHASPPCQRYTALSRGTNGNVEEYPDLVGVTREALDEIGLPYVIENVPTAPLRKDLVLCGLMFGLKVFRHRVFELGNWKTEQPQHLPHKGHRVAGWRHGVRYDGDIVAVYGDGGGKGSVTDWQNAMGIHWTDVRKELAEAIPPRYTQFIGTELLRHIDG
jgi:site-specific DNA-cytosine methylase